MWGFIGSIIGLGAGFFVSYFFIFPNDMLNLRLAMITMGDILRILGGIIVLVIGSTIGYWIGHMFDDN
jgi:hypothetical protein